uniref:Uncharacterized protein n=1 Tax=Aegilops tauschii subsp. strangulata TaxID=200361 RepID=A0A453HKJ7_AEGTS
MRIVGAAKPERMSSMEREPKTLSLGELNYARVSKAPSLPARQIFAHTYHEKLEITLSCRFVSFTHANYCSFPAGSSAVRADHALLAGRSPDLHRGNVHFTLLLVINQLFPSTFARDFCSVTRRAARVILCRV